MDPNLGTIQGATTGNVLGLGQYTPTTQGVFYSQANNPYAPAAIGGAQAGGQALTQQGGQNLNTSNYMASVPGQLAPFVQSTLNTAYDPQNQLKALLEQKSADTTNADLASRGLQYSPFGAGVASTADQLFQTNWLDTLLGRQQTGANTAATLLGTGNQTAQTGAALGNQGATQLAQGGALPYTVQTGINQEIAQFLPYLTSNQQQEIQDLLQNYSAANVNTGNAVTAGHYQDQADAALGTGIGSLLGMMFPGLGNNLLGLSSPGTVAGVASSAA